MPDIFPQPPDLFDCLRRLLAQIPPGRVTTCGELAVAFGDRVAATWIGFFSLHHEHNAACPCHRILRAGGKIGPYITGDVLQKIKRLQAEGVRVDDDAVDLERFAFRGFSGNRPLEQLRQIQQEIQSRIVLQEYPKMPEFVGAVDVAYPAPGVGSAAYALVETATGRLAWSRVIRRAVRFPYITTFLAFRELPLYLDLLAEVRAAGKMAEVLLVDGSGVLHERHAGVASHLGVVAAAPTVGVTKKPLYGSFALEGIQPGESRPVFAEEKTERIGVAICPKSGSRRPIFASPGHRVDVAFAERLVLELLRSHRLPEPLYWADRLSRQPQEDN
jgi:deoxyribonuclease V